MQEYKRSIVIFTYIAIFSLIVPAIFWFNSLSQDRKQANNLVEEKPLIPPSNRLENQPEQNLDIAKRISVGEKILIAADQNPNKQAAIQAFAAGNYRNAITKYDASLQIQRNDPEAWIYQNNAKAIASNNFFKIAVSVPIGGNLNVAKEILRGVAQVQQEVNSHGGIKGKLLQVAIANDDNDPLTAEKMARHLSQDDKILGVIGHNSTEASVAAAPIYQQSGLVMISPTSVGSSLSGIGSYIFRTTPDTRTTADILARYTVESARQSKVAVCFASDAKASQSFKDAFEWSIFQAGGKVIETNCDFSQPNFNPVDVPTQAISSGADALLLAPSIYNINQAIAVIQANKNRLPLLANQSMYTFETLEQGSLDANNMVLSVAWHSGTDQDRIFAQEAQSLWGGGVGWRTAMAYDAAKAMVEGLESQSNPSRQQLQTTLANPDFAFAGATGIVKFLPSGDRNLKGVLVKVESGNQSGVGYDFVAVKP
jgi:branched-chain amino acid transport system substrate-binding protein